MELAKYVTAISLDQKEVHFLGILTIYLNKIWRLLLRIPAIYKSIILGV